MKDLTPFSLRSALSRQRRNEKGNGRRGSYSKHSKYESLRRVRESSLVHLVVVVASLSRLSDSLGLVVDVLGHIGELVLGLRADPGKLKNEHLVLELIVDMVDTKKVEVNRKDL